MSQQVRSRHETNQKLADRRKTQIIKIERKKANRLIFENFLWIDLIWYWFTATPSMEDKDSIHEHEIKSNSLEP